jgi:hypothetical protein
VVRRTLEPTGATHVTHEHKRRAIHPCPLQQHARVSGHIASRQNPTLRQPLQAPADSSPAVARVPPRSALRLQRGVVRGGRTRRARRPNTNQPLPTRLPTRAPRTAAAIATTDDPDGTDAPGDGVARAGLRDNFDSVDLAAHTLLLSYSSPTSRPRPRSGRGTCRPIPFSPQTRPQALEGLPRKRAPPSAAPPTIPRTQRSSPPVPSNRQRSHPRISSSDGICPAPERLTGQMIDVRITAALPHSLRAEVPLIAP